MLLYSHLIFFSLFSRQQQNTFFSNNNLKKKSNPTHNLSIKRLIQINKNTKKRKKKKEKKTVDVCEPLYPIPILLVGTHTVYNFPSFDHFLSQTPVKKGHNEWLVLICHVISVDKIVVNNKQQGDRLKKKKEKKR